MLGWAPAKGLWAIDILYRILREVLTGKIFEHRSEGRKMEKSSRNLDKYIPGRENYYKDLVKGMHGMFGNRKKAGVAGATGVCMGGVVLLKPC